MAALSLFPSYSFSASGESQTYVCVPFFHNSRDGSLLFALPFGDIHIDFYGTHPSLCVSWGEVECLHGALFSAPLCAPFYRTSSYAQLPPELRKYDVSRKSYVTSGRASVLGYVPLRGDILYKSRAAVERIGN